MPTNKRSKRKAAPEAGALPKRRHDLYYLYAGMGHGTRKRFVRNLIWALLIGAVVAAVLSGALYLASKP